MQETDRGRVALSVEDGIATLSFSHPARNSLPGRLLGEIAAEIQQLGSNREARVIILRSSGEGVFCAGASFDELSSVQNEEEATAFFSGFARVIHAMRHCPKLILGRVQGKAVGGGVGLAAASDICYATGEASVKLSELAIGIGPFVVGPAVERKMGKAAFSQMSIEATSWFSANWAREQGLFARVFDSVEEMDAAIAGLSARLASSHPEAMAELKKIFWEDTAQWDKLLEERASISGKLVLSEFTLRAIEQFKNRK